MLCWPAMSFYSYKTQDNVLSIKETKFLHDRGLCMSTLATQNLLKVNKVNIFRNNEWPRASPDFSACEHLRMILKGRVEQCLQNTREELVTALNNVLKEMEFDHDLLVSFGILLHMSGGSSVSGYWAHQILKQSSETALGMLNDKAFFPVRGFFLPLLRWAGQGGGLRCWDTL